MMQNILKIITLFVFAFEPFNNQELNSSWEAVNSLKEEIEIINQSETIQAKIIKYKLPCVFDQAGKEAIAEIKKTKPAIVIVVGQRDESGGKINIEKQAKNLDNADKCPDNEGNQPLNKTIIEGGQDQYLSTLPIEEIKKELGEKLALISESAGSFVCNNTFYWLMNYINKNPHLNLMGGFIHVPCLPEKNSDKSNNMPLRTIVDGLEVIIKTSSLIFIEKTS